MQMVFSFSVVLCGSRAKGQFVFSSLLVILKSFKIYFVSVVLTYPLSYKKGQLYSFFMEKQV